MHRGSPRWQAKTRTNSSRNDAPVLRRFGLNPFAGCGRVCGPTVRGDFAMNTSFSKGPLFVGCVWGVVTGLTPFFQPIEPAARWALGLGLGLTYATVGLLVGLLPDFHLPGGRRWLQGGLTGLLYSVPGAVFTMAPYPLREDAPTLLERVRGGRRPRLLPDALLRRGRRRDLRPGPQEILTALRSRSLSLPLRGIGSYLRRAMASGCSVLGLAFLSS